MPNGDETTTVNLKDGTILHLKGKLSSEQVQEKVSAFRRFNPEKPPPSTDTKQKDNEIHPTDARTIPNIRTRTALRNPVEGMEGMSPLHVGYEGLKSGMLLGSIPAAAVSPGPAARSLAGGMIGSKVGTSIAEASGAGSTGQELTGDLFGLFGAGLTEGGYELLKGKMPSTAHSAEAFEKLKTLAKNVDISSKGPAEIADKAMSFREGGTPQVMKDFYNRVTRSGSTRLTYEEARGYYSDATKLLKDPSLDSSMRPFVMQFVDSLGNEIKTGIKTLGPEAGTKYESAMKEYRNAKGVEEGLEKLKNMAIKKVIPYATYYAIAKLILGNTAKHALREITP